LHAFDVYKNRMWVIGGFDYFVTNQTHPFVNDVWSSSDGVQWKRETVNASWHARDLHSCVAFNNRLWIMGGGSTEGNYNDVWSYGLHIVPDALPDAEWDKPYSATFTAREGTGPFDWSIAGGALPPGWTLGTSTSDTVSLSGPPAQPGTFTFTMRVEDQGTGDWAEQEITLKIKPPPSPEDRGADDGGFGSCTIAPETTGGIANTRALALAALVSLFAATVAAFRWQSARTER
jgi:hypothetical protein